MLLREKERIFERALQKSFKLFSSVVCLYRGLTHSDSQTEIKSLRTILAFATSPVAESMGMPCVLPTKYIRGYIDKKTGLFVLNPHYKFDPANPERDTEIAIAKKELSSLCFVDESGNVLTEDMYNNIVDLGIKKSKIISHKAELSNANIYYVVD